MLTSPTDIPIKPIKNLFSRLGIFVAGLALLVTGCDVVSQQSNDGEKEVTYEVTNDLGERLTVASQNGAKAAAPAKSTSFTIRAQVTPPTIDPEGGTERASHVSFNEHHDKLYAGYMIRGDGPGNGFGGGVDIISVDKGAGTLDGDPPGSNVNALQVDGVDVQESTSTKDFLLLGVAEEESFDIGNTPSEVHSIHIFPGDGTPESSGGTVDFDDRDLPGRLVKGVTNSPPSDGTHEFYAITDANTLHQISVGGPGVITGVTTDETSGFPGVEFRGLAANGAAGWAMDDGGNIWTAPTGGGLVRALTFPTPDFFDDDPTDDFGPLDTIARVTSPEGGPTCDGASVVFTALNNDGFRVIKTAGSGAPAEVFKSDPFPATSVTATSDFVYVASGRQMALYSVESGLCDETDTDAGLRRIGMARLDTFGDASSFTFGGGQINEIVHLGSDLLAIAKGTDGVYLIEQGTGTYPTTP